MLGREGEEVVVWVVGLWLAIGWGTGCVKRMRLGWEGGRGMRWDQVVGKGL